MSITSRSQSSSPDILGPPGDADYLISSPIKPFAGRQSWLSPAIIRRQQTPAKRPRLSFSPTKSAQSIRFDDVILPGSPTMKLNGRQRSLSPEKILQPDGDVSPWRIRVTLEATQDEENHGTPSRKRLRPSTMTTMVPLKDEPSPLIEKTPAKRRGRPRKSGMPAQNGSPWPGSPGNTPGLRETPLRKRGRPRKGTPKLQMTDITMAEDEPTPAPQTDFSPMDLTIDNDNVGRQWSPINFAADGGSDSDSIGADDLPLTNLRPTPARVETWTHTSGHEYGRTNYDTPVINHFEDVDERINSTPSKMPSPMRERQALSSRSSRLASNTSSPHTYPTPTPTSSPIEEEIQAIEDREDDNSAPNDHNFEHDPTDDHEEFDSIMESEGFTMISLDTLPSARHHGLGSGSRTATDNPTKILQDRHNGRIGERLKRKLPGIDDLKIDSHSSARPSPVADGPSPTQPAISDTPQGSDRHNRQIPTPALFYPEIFATDSPKPASAKEQSRTKLLQNFEEVSDEEEEKALEEEQKVEEVVQTISHKSEQENSPQPSPMASIRARQEAEWELERETVSRHAEASMSAGRAVYIDSDENDPQEEDKNLHDNFDDHVDYDSEIEVVEEVIPEELAFPYDSEYDDYVDGEPEGFEPGLLSKPKLEQAEVVEIDDDVSDDIWRQEVRPEPRPERRIWEPEPVPEQEFEAEQESEPEPGSELEPEAISIAQEEGRNEEILADGEGDDYGDIWQQEALDNSDISPNSIDHPEASPGKTSPWRQIDISANQNHQSSSPVYVTMEYDNEPWLEPTHIRKLRDQEVDLSALLAQDDTPNRARYFSGTSTPRSILDRRYGSQNTSINGSLNLASNNADRRARLQPISQSPERDSPAVAQHLPTQSDDDKVSVSNSGLPEMEMVRENSSAATPEPHASKDGTAASSWFSKITSLTPRWLKAPAQSRYDNHSVIPDEEQVGSHQSDKEELGDIDSAGEIHDNAQHELLPDPSIQSPEMYPILPRIDEEYPEPSVDAPSDGESPLEHDIHSAKDAYSVENSPPREEIGELSIEKSVSEDAVADDDHDHAVSLLDDSHNKPERPRPLAVFGYFSDAHYVALRRIYQMAKRHPERVKYFDTPSRDEIIGDWIWASDGRHGVPITEVQFAIIDRFTYELSRANMQNGGSGNIGWTEADLHRRLISIIIGEQIREEQKVKAVRGTSVDTLR
ncbi:hypothetical protein N7495_008622 [Penicillium taxi]|uniref:uncharacterized protein n=1 Tax=Penicillium taxi TaxID=168475 RepID=UPI0025456E31|nr:uncharacterized protein N7495_008622 [Penicillium taxi]KAJ5888581.1 hypothetical protein N7495_008622 [Penicillium taxi]